MIRKVAPAGKPFSNAAVCTLKAWLHGQGDGLYTAGLDNHVGFIRVNFRKALSIDSNDYQRAIGVKAEPLKGRNLLTDAHYRCIEQLLSDEMVRRRSERRAAGP